VTITINGANETTTTTSPGNGKGKKGGAAGGNDAAPQDTSHGNANGHDKVAAEENMPTPSQQDTFFQSKGLSVLDHILLAPQASADHDHGPQAPEVDPGLLQSLLGHDALDVTLIGQNGAF
jgi:hypothetical protein